MKGGLRHRVSHPRLEPVPKRSACKTLPPAAPDPHPCRGEGPGMCLQGAPSPCPAGSRVLRQRGCADPTAPSPGSPQARERVPVLCRRCRRDEPSPALGSRPTPFAAGGVTGDGTQMRHPDFPARPEGSEQAARAAANHPGRNPQCRRCQKRPVQQGHLPPPLSHRRVPFPSNHRPHCSGMETRRDTAITAPRTLLSTAASGTLCPIPSLVP